MLIKRINSEYGLNNYQNNNDKTTFGARPIPAVFAETIKSKLLNNSVKSVDIYCHSSPDEDTINSAKVIGNWFNKHGIKTSFCIDASDLKSLYVGHGKLNIKNSNQPSDLSLILDFNSKSKMPKSCSDVFEKSRKVFGFDHHQKTTDFLGGEFYRDDSAYSCCGVLTRFFEATAETLSKGDLKSLYCGIVSDYQKSKLVKIVNTKDGFNLVKLPALYSDPNSRYILEKFERNLSNKEKAKIYKHLDILSNLTQKEKDFRNKIFSEVKITPNGKLGYLVIEPYDKEWKSLGMDNARTSYILRDLRLQLLNNVSDNEFFTPEQKQNFKNLQGAAVFYRANDAYQLSITTKEDYAKRLTDYIKEHINPDLVAGGHADRMGAKIFSIEKNQVDNFINSFLIASEKV